MSTHIHKIMGYGAKHPNRTQLNARFENSQPNEVHNLLNAHFHRLKNDNDVGWRSLGFQLRYNDIKYPNTLGDVVHYAQHPDYDDGYTVIMPPTNFNTWYRFSNDIDWYEELLTDDSMDNRIKFITNPIYPYSEWMNKDTGEILSYHDKHLLTETNDYVPYVPVAIQIIAHEIGFEDWKVLRPMIITWWC